MIRTTHYGAAMLESRAASRVSTGQRRLVLCGIWVAACCALTPYPTRADIYSLTDEAGTMHLTNIADDVHYAVVVGEPRSDKAAAVKAPAQPRPTAAAGEPKAGPKYAALISAIAREQQVQPGLLHAIVSVESRYNANAVSPKNAAGLMQLMPATASRYGVRDRFDPSENLRAGASYLRDLLHRFNNDLPLALAAYNAGENSVIRYGNRIPPFPETQMYVPQVLDLFRNYVEQPSDAVSSPVLR